MVYQWKAASHISVDAQVAGEVCEQLAERGSLTAKSLLDASRDENAPLHDAFEWRDEVAGELYREDQARHIIRSLCVEKEQSSEPVKAYFNITQDDRKYEHIDAILKKPDDMQKLLESALLELRAIQKKYSQLKMLSGIFQQIDQISLELGKKLA